MQSFFTVPSPDNHNEGSKRRLSAAASLIMGQADEGLPVVIVRGFDSFDVLRNADSNIKPVLMPREADVFRK